MTVGAGERLSRNDLAIDKACAAISDEFLAPTNAADRDISDEARARITQILGLFRILRHFYYSSRYRLSQGLFGRNKQVSLDPRFWHKVCFNDSGPGRPFHGCEIRRRLFHFFVSHGPRQTRHHRRVRLAWVGRSTQVVPEILKLPNEISDRLSHHRCVLWTTLAGREMAVGTAPGRRSQFDRPAGQHVGH